MRSVEWPESKRMDHVTTIMDGFYHDPQALRRRVLASAFGDFRGPDGALYQNTSAHAEPELFPLVESAIGHRILPKLAGFRLDLGGIEPHSAVHSDDICATHASVLYLNPPEQCQGGTAFWTHRETGWDASPRGVSAEAVATFVKDWEDADKWEMSGFVGMKFNRFLTYPTKLVHSRWPRGGFGTGKQDGRLIWVCFFDVDSRYSVR